jgi:CheY-like chemotaxis protein
MVKTVLIVDDNAFVRRALRNLLTRELGVEVREAQNGKEAIDKTGELRPDLIVLDISMPLMNGGWIRQNSKKLDNPKGLQPEEDPRGNCPKTHSTRFLSNNIAIFDCLTASDSTTALR